MPKCVSAVAPLVAGLVGYRDGRELRIIGADDAAIGVGNVCHAAKRVVGKRIARLQRVAAGLGGIKSCGAVRMACEVLLPQSVKAGIHLVVVVLVGGIAFVVPRA